MVLPRVETGWLLGAAVVEGVLVRANPPNEVVDVLWDDAAWPNVNIFWFAV